jgi:hypothetical protein
VNVSERTAARAFVRAGVRASVRASVSGKFIFLGEDKFYVRGVTTELFARAQTAATIPNQES